MASREQILSLVEERYGVETRKCCEQVIKEYQGKRFTLTELLLKSKEKMLERKRYASEQQVMNAETESEEWIPMDEYWFWLGTFTVSSITLISLWIAGGFTLIAITIAVLLLGFSAYKIRSQIGDWIANWFSSFLTVSIVGLILSGIAYGISKMEHPEALFIALGVLVFMFVAAMIFGNESEKTQQGSKANGIWKVIGCILLIAWLFGNKGNNSSRLDSPRYDAEIDGRVNIKSQIEKDVISPSTLSFPISMDFVRNGNGYSVSSYFDSQNGFGATIRTHYTAYVNSSGTVQSINYKN